jgi:NTE family protein
MPDSLATIRRSLGVAPVIAVAIALSVSASSAACAPPGGPIDTPTALVFSGGGAKGAWEAGVAAALVAQGVPIRVAAGSSAGALNAVMVADGRLDRLEGVWRSLTREQVYALRPSVLFSGLLPGWLTLLTLNRAGSLFDPQPLRALLAASLDLERVRASNVRLLVVASDLARRDKRLFDNRTVTLDALMAAVAVPGAFPPVAVDGALLVDGGLIARAPVIEALEGGVPVRRALVAMSYAADEHGGPPTTIRRALEEAFEMAMTHQIRRDTELARLKYPSVDIELLVPSKPLALRPLDFDPAALTRALAQGHADALACLKSWPSR